MWEVSKTFTIEAAHQLPNHPGKCSRLHGHRWKITLAVQGELDKNGMVIDYADIKAAAAPLIETMDHHNLNHLIANPTSENLATFVFVAMKVLLPGLAWVEVEETEGSRCRYADK